MKDKIFKLINKYVNKEWKRDKSFPMYSNQYFAFEELRCFWLELLELLKKEKK